MERERRWILRGEFQLYLRKYLKLYRKFGERLKRMEKTRETVSHV